MAVLGSPAQRATAQNASSRGHGPLKRRLVVAVLVLASLALITVYFREAQGGVLHGAQSAGATVLHPFEVGAERVARPFHDAYNYSSGLVNAKSENGKLRAEVDQLRQQVIQNQTALQENAHLRAALHYVDSPRFPTDYYPVNARVIAQPPSEFEQQIVISAGSANGVPASAPVVTNDGLVGQVTLRASHATLVTLLTDASFAVAAKDLGSRAFGILRHGQGTGSLILDRVPKDQVVQVGDTVVTAGSQLGSRLPSSYPVGIPIGRVTSVGQSDTDLYKQIQVQAFVELGGLDAVTVLASRKPVPHLP